MNFNERGHNRTLETGGVGERIAGFTRRHDSGALQEAFGGGPTVTPPRLIINRLQEKARARGEQAEVKEMLETVLKAGGRQIVQRMKELDAKIADEECQQPELGTIIEAYYVPFLLSALALSDEEFDAEYPGEGQVSAAQRAELSDAIDAHAYDCPRCLLKASSDWEWYHYVDGAPARDAELHQFQVK